MNPEINNPESLESKPRLKVLEIGVGTTPYYERLGKELDSNITFVGLDISYKDLKINRDKNLNLNLVNANAQEVPFENSSFDEVVLNSVFGAPSTGSYQNREEYESNDQNYYGKNLNELLNDKLKILEQAMALVKPGGKIKIFELYGVYNKELMLQIFKKLIENNFRRIKLDSVKDTDKDLVAFDNLENEFITDKSMYIYQKAT